MVYLVRSLELCARAFLSRLARSTLLSKTESLPPRGAPSVQNGATRMRIRLSSKPFKHIACCWIVSTYWIHRISTLLSTTGARPKPKLCHACGSLIDSKTHPPLEGCRQIRRRPKRKSLNLKKDHLQVLALALNPSRNLVPESKPRGRGQFQSNFSASLFRCWVHARDSKNAQPATVRSRFIFYTIGPAADARGASRKLLDLASIWAGGSACRRHWRKPSSIKSLGPAPLWFVGTLVFAAPDDCAELMHGPHTSHRFLHAAVGISSRLTTKQNFFRLRRRGLVKNR